MRKDSLHHGEILLCVPLLEEAYRSVDRAALADVAGTLEAANTKVESFEPVKELEDTLRNGILELSGKLRDLDARLRFSPSDPMRLFRVYPFIDDGKRGIAEASLGLC